MKRLRDNGEKKNFDKKKLEEGNRSHEAKMKNHTTKGNEEMKRKRFFFLSLI